MSKKVLYPHIPKGKKFTHQEYLEKMKAAINADIASSRIPPTVKSLSELHDYVDANDYLNIPFPHYNIARDTDEANRYLDELDLWIKQGRR